MPTVQDYEKLGSFYLGKKYDLAGRKLLDELVNYESKDLVTHALCVGMTGSGKTGLCLSLLEEAAIDGVPAICIDPKGDLANLLLTFPDLRPADFEPWINPDDARKKGSRPPTSPRNRPNCGRKAWPVGTRTATASAACAKPPNSPSTRRAATPAFRFPFLIPSPRRRRPSSMTTN